MEGCGFVVETCVSSVTVWSITEADALAAEQTYESASRLNQGRSRLTCASLKASTYPFCTAHLTWPCFSQKAPST